jgi:hypothetical protein
MVMIENIGILDWLDAWRAVQTRQLSEEHDNIARLLSARRRDHPGRRREAPVSFRP